jgi:protein-tyrosine-phosphatase
MTVHFVCRGNAFRSLIAETYLRSLHLKQVTVYSSGTVAAAHRESNQAFFAQTKVLLARHGIAQFAKQYSDQLTPVRLVGADYTICMNQDVYDELSAIAPPPPETIIWSIADVDDAMRINGAPIDRDAFLESAYPKITQAVDDFIASKHLL